MAEPIALHGGDVLGPVLANVEAEQSLLAAILSDNRCYDQVSDRLLPDHFVDATHARTFAAIARYIEAGKRVDAISLANSVAHQEPETAEYLRELQVSAVNTDVRGYAAAIEEMYRRRELRALGQFLVHEAQDAEWDEQVQAASSEASDRLDQLSDTSSDSTLRPITSGMDGWIERVEAAIKNGGKLTGVSSGLTDLDGFLGGWNAPDLIILAARPGMFKTAAGVHFALSAARAGMPVAFFGLEMGEDQIGGRVLAAESGIAHDRQRKGMIDPYEFDSLVAARNRLSSLPLHLDDTPYLSLQQIRSRCRRFKRKMGGRLALVLIDYLQLMAGSGKAENRVQEVSAISRGLKLMAKHLDCPIIAMSQLNRGLENREDKRPNLSDLRESGSIEQDADVVIFNHYEAKYLRKAKPQRKLKQTEFEHAEELADWEANVRACENKLELIIGKNRHGPEGAIEVHLTPEQMTLSDLYKGEGCAQ